jgi:predicted transcriptional regulator
MVRSLEAKGYLAHTPYGNTYQYYAVVSETEHGGTTIKGAVSRYFENSYLTAVSALVKEEKISVDELKQLIEQIEKGSN